MINLLFGVLAFVFMEFVAWFSHKYIMHGFLWKWHRDHHLNDHTSQEGKVNKHFEKNDFFFLIYALPAIVLLIVGLINHKWVLVSMGIGITIYGFTYFTVHDVAIHKRLPLRIFKNTKSKYIKALLEAHKGHHRPKNKSQFDSFGLLIFPFHYLKSDQ